MVPANVGLLPDQLSARQRQHANCESKPHSQKVHHTKVHARSCISNANRKMTNTPLPPRADWARPTQQCGTAASNAPRARAAAASRARLQCPGTAGCGAQMPGDQRRLPLAARRALPLPHARHCSAPGLALLPCTIHAPFVSEIPVSRCAILVAGDHVMLPFDITNLSQGRPYASSVLTPDDNIVTSANKAHPA